MKWYIFRAFVIVLFVVGLLLPFSTPVYADAELTFTCSSSDVYIRGEDDTYSEARLYGAPGGAEYIMLYTGGTSMTLGQKTPSTNATYAVYRDYLFFNTSSIPDGATITSATLKLYGYTDNSTTDFNIVVQNGMPTYPHDPVVYADYDPTLYSGDGGSLSTASFTTSGYNEIELNGTGLTWINDTGYTKFILRSSRDINSNTPTGNEYVAVYTNEQGTGYYPQLVVTYAIDAPDITTNAASSVSGTTARLNATVVDDGGEACQVRWGWGETSESAIEDYDHYTSYAGSYVTDDHPYYDVDSLDVSTLYYFRTEIQNSEDTDLGGELSFTTTSGVDDPTNFNAYPSATSVSLTWTKGSGATNSVVRYKTDDYPSTYTDGFLVYDGSSSSYTHTNLTPGTTYYYAVWGYSGAIYSSGSAEVMATTSAGSAGDGDITGPSTPWNWLIGTDYTNMSGLGPLYDGWNLVADSMSIPRNTHWFLSFLLACVGAAVVAYWLGEGSAFVALAVFTIVGAFCWRLQVMPLAIPVTSAMISAAMFFVKRREGY